METVIQNQTSQTPSPDSKPKKFNWRPLRALGIWVSALALAILINQVGFQSYQVFGNSMVPTLDNGDYLIISKIPATISNLTGKPYIPKRGEIIVFDSPFEDARIIKRVIALPSERIVISGGQVTVFNSEHRMGFNPYAELSLPSTFVAGEVTELVPAGHVFVIGDNREESGASSDSRNNLGPLPVEQIIGRLELRLWPFSKIQNF